MAGYTQEKLSLERAIQTGLLNNFSVLLQKNEAAIARNNNTIGNAGFLPLVTLTAAQNNTINTTHQEQFSGTIKDIDNAKSSSLNTGMQVNWTIFDGFRMFVNREMLQTLEELGENGTRMVMEEFVANVSTLYYGIVQTKKLVRVSKEAVELSNKRLMIAEAKLSIGSGSQLMQMQSTVDRNTDSTRVLQQLSSLAGLKADFNRLIGRDPLVAFDVEDTIMMRGIPAADTLFLLAERQNATLAAARLRTRLSQAGIRDAESLRYPRINLTGAYGYSSSSSETGFLKEGRNYGPSYGISLSYVLFNGFNITRTVQNAKTLMNSSDIKEKETAVMVKSELVKLTDAYFANRNIVSLQSANTEVARANLEIAFEKYRLGSLSDLELRDIQRKLIESDYQYILAQFEVVSNEIEIARYAGTLLQTTGK
jgi:outer membrane protein TolC